MTVRCQKNQNDLKAALEANSQLVSTVEKLKTTVGSQEKTIKELEAENKSHLEIVSKVFGKDDAEEKQNEKSSSEDVQQKLKDMKLSHAAALRNKNAEIRSLKATADVLEKDIQQRNEKIVILEDKLEACQHEKRRADDINDILTGLKCDLGVGRLQDNSESSSETNKVGEKDDLAVSHSGKIAEKSTDKEKPVCHSLFMTGKCEDASCQKEKWHMINMRKVRRGICVHEFAQKDSCQWGKKCMYTHDFPPEIFKDQSIITEQEVLRRKIQDRKESFNHGGRKQEQSSYQKEHQEKEEQPERRSKKVAFNRNEKKIQPTETNAKTNLCSINKTSNSKLVQGVADNSHGVNQSFLELIRPMIMDQLTPMVGEFLRSQEAQLQEKVQKFMSTQQFKTI